MKLHNTTDRIERQIVVKAPRSRVWRALSDAKQFGAWFGIKIDGAFAPGAHVHGQISFSPHQQVIVDFAIERMDPESRFSYRWHPYAIEPGVDYSSEPMTLVEFHLEEVAEGTQIKVVESGFDHIPLARRAEALRMNNAGWDEQLEKLAGYVAE
jgi:uncharacterized protein YndB with AHSA1/START domain